MVSIITPVFNAQATLERTLASVAAQKFSDWEHIVVIDGATDDSEGLARRAADNDPRRHIIVQPNAGASTARNRGIDAARGEWLLFLDSDDTISPNHLSRMMAHMRHPDIDAVCCGYRRLDGQGHTVARYSAPRLDGQALSVALIRPPAAIHAFVVRRTLIQSMGGFDPSLETNEDWDLWMKLVRGGAHFAREPRILADYHGSARSLTSNPVAMLRDAAVIRKRAGIESPEHALRAVLWSGGLDIAIGGDGSTTLAFVEPLKAPVADWSSLHAAMFEGIMLGSGKPFSGLIDIWGELAPRITAFLNLVASRAEAPKLVAKIARDLEWDVVRTGQFSGKKMVGETLAVMLDLGVFWNGIDEPGSPARIVFKPPFLRPRGKFMFFVTDRLKVSAKVSGREMKTIIIGKSLRFLTSSLWLCASGKAFNSLKRGGQEYDGANRYE
jgi:hypothetical protein